MIHPKSGIDGCTWDGWFRLGAIRCGNRTDMLSSWNIPERLLWVSERDNTCTDQDIIFSEGFRVVQVSRVIFPWGDNAQLLRRHTYRYYWTYAVIPRPMQTVLVDKRIRMCLRIACGCRERHYIPSVARANANSNASLSPSVVLSNTEPALERTARACHCKGWEGPVTMLKFV